MKVLKLVLVVGCLLVWTYGHNGYDYRDYKFDPNYDYKYDKSEVLFNKYRMGWKKYRQRYSILPKRCFQLYAEYVIKSAKNTITKARKLEIAKEMFAMEEPYYKATLWLKDYDKYGFFPDEALHNLKSLLLKNLPEYKKKFEKRERERKLYYWAGKQGYSLKNATKLTEASIAMRSGDLTKAEKLFESDFFDDDITYDYLRVFYDSKNWQKIIDFYQKYHKTWSKSFVSEKRGVFFYTAKAYHYTNQPEKVKEVLKYYNDRRPAVSKKLVLEIYDASVKPNILIKTYE